MRVSAEQVIVKKEPEEEVQVKSEPVEEAMTQNLESVQCTPENKEKLTGEEMTFDRVWQEGLLCKLQSYGISGPILEWFISY